MYTNVVRGCDPELFLVNLTTNSLISAVGKVGGSKHDPRPILSGNGFAVQEDNVAVEFNIPPSHNLDEFKGNIREAMSFLAEELSKKGLTLCCIPSANFPMEELQTPEAQAFGCDPDYCVWTRSMNRPPQCQNPALRSAGGHLHLSWDEEKTISSKEMMIKAHDLFVGAPMIMYDRDQQRRELYGKAGAFRFKPYGVEYRTLSNHWLSSPDLVEFVYYQSEKAVDFLNNGGTIHPEDGHLIVNAINTGNQDTVVTLQGKYGML